MSSAENFARGSRLRCILDARMRVIIPPCPELPSYHLDKLGKQLLSEKDRTLLASHDCRRLGPHHPHLDCTEGIYEVHLRTGEDKGAMKLTRTPKLSTEKGRVYSRSWDSSWSLPSLITWVCGSKLPVLQTKKLVRAACCLASGNVVCLTADACSGKLSQVLFS